MMKEEQLQAKTSNIYHKFTFTPQVWSYVVTEWADSFSKYSSIEISVD